MISDKFPSNPETEKHIIGQTILDGRINPEAFTLKPADFYSASTRDIWQTIQEMDADGAQLDVLTIHNRVRAARPENLMAASEIAAFASRLVGGKSLAGYVKELKTLSALRYLVRQSERIQKDSLAENPVEEILAKMEKTIASVRNHFGTDNGHFQHVREIVDTELIKALKDFRAGISHKISCGFAPLDNVSGGGIAPGEVWPIGAFTGGGKSAFGLQIGRHMAKQGTTVLFVSREMSNLENALRMISQISGMDLWKLKAGLSQADYEFLIDWLGAMRELPIYFDAKTNNMQSLAKSVQAFKREHPQEKIILIVDYLQLMKAKPELSDNYFAEVTNVSLAMKNLAMDEQIGVIPLIQFNREAAKSGKAEAHSSKGSSQIEQDASAVIIIELEETNDDDWKAPRSGFIRIAKGRNMPKAKFPVVYHGSTLTFVETDLERAF